MRPKNVKSINEFQRFGKEQAEQFMKERLVTKAKDIDAPIKKKQAIIIFARKLKRDAKLFAQLFITA